VRRREFITLLGGAATWPLAARAQQPTKLPTIGFLGTTTLSAMGGWVAAFVQRLRELGWIEGRNIAIEYRWAEARSERYGEIAAELVQSKVDVIVTTAPAFPAVQRATSVIPIVFALSPADPVAAGFIASLARPGGNATGLSMLSPDTAGKRLELLREIVPGIRRLAVMVNLGFPDAVQEGSEAHAAASALGLEVVKLEIRRPQDIASSFESLKADALYVTGDPLFNANRIRINTFALSARLPTIYPFREHVEAGGLMSYGVNIPDLFRRAAGYVDRILRGTKPADLPVEQPIKFDLIVSVIRCHTRRSTAAYLYKHVACSRKSCFVIFGRSARCVAPSRLIRMAIDGGISRISSQSVSDRRRLKIGRCPAIGKAICCPVRRTAISRPSSSVVPVT
jgi:putative tryptophan/tyrosine transport system substrate-binding protein